MNLLGYRVKRLEKSMLRTYILGLFFIVAAALNAQAKDLTYRLGAGFKNNSSEDIPSMALVYFADKEYAYTGSFGFDSKQGNSTMQISGGLRKIIFYENNLNCYIGGQLGLVNVETPVSGTKSGVDVLAVGGVEFFFNGLENLGFSLETGLGLSTVNSTRVRTLADDPIRAGIVFYF